MSSFINWLSNKNEAGRAAESKPKNVVLPEHDEQLRQYVSIYTEEDSQIHSGDFVVTKKTVTQNLWDVGPFARGPAYVIHVSTNSRNRDSLGFWDNATIVYSNGDKICSTKIDSRCIVSTTDDGDLASVDPLLKAFVEDGVNVSNDCAVGSPVRPRTGTRFGYVGYARSGTSSFGANLSTIPILDSAMVLRTPLFNPIDLSLSFCCTDKATLVGFDEATMKICVFEVEAFKICRRDVTSPQQYDDDDANLCV